jgi:tRNA nucleotidyltransferase (CCA-adding enzyme)
LTQLPKLPANSVIPALAREASARGGRLIVVGGWVRDQLRGEDSKDLDVEFFGLSLDEVSRLLEAFDSIGRVGQHFPVWRLRHQSVDLCYPRDGALDYESSRPESLEAAFRAAARHRDLTVNAIGWDPLSEVWIDPWRGIADLEAGRLCAVDATTFGTDPLRGLRVARLHARLEAEVESRTLELCRALDLSSVPIERIASELRRLLVEPLRPSRALRFLDLSGLIDLFPPLADLRGVPQDPYWHPEGDVFVHTCLVVDAARQIGGDLEASALEILQWSALAHDLGKPTTTSRDENRVRSLGHERVGVEIARNWLEELRVSHHIVSAVAVLIAHHLKPAQFISQNAGPRAYRRLARKLAAGRMTAVDLERLARADHLGRTTEDARAGRFEAGDAFLAMASAEGVAQGVHHDVVTAKQLMSHGFRPGPILGKALARAREIQDERGWQESRKIIELLRVEFMDPKDPRKPLVEPEA